MTDAAPPAVPASSPAGSSLRVRARAHAARLATQAKFAAVIAALTNRDYLASRREAAHRERHAIDISTRAKIDDVACKLVTAEAAVQHLESSAPGSAEASDQLATALSEQRALDQSLKEATDERARVMGDANDECESAEREFQAGEETLSQLTDQAGLKTADLYQLIAEIGRPDVLDLIGCVRPSARAARAAFLAELLRNEAAVATFQLQLVGANPNLDRALEQLIDSARDYEEQRRARTLAQRGEDRALAALLTAQRDVARLGGFPLLPEPASPTENDTTTADPMRGSEAGERQQDSSGEQGAERPVAAQTTAADSPSDVPPQPASPATEVTPS